MIAAVALCALAVLDGAFSGYRAAAGRNGLVAKRAYYARALLLGAASGLVVLGVIASVCAISLSGGWGAAVSLDDLVTAGRRMLALYLPCALLVLGAVACYLVPRLDARSLATVLVLGPMTLVRPVVIAAGGVAAGWGEPAEVWLVAAVAVVCVLAVEPALGWVRYGRIEG